MGAGHLSGGRMYGLSNQADQTGCPVAGD
jgi:hypothetical protein